MSDLSNWEWDPDDMFVVEQGFHTYMDTLMFEVMEGYGEIDPPDTASGFPFCGCDTCVVRETMAYLMPRMLDLYEQGLIKRVPSQEPSKEADSDL